MTLRDVWTALRFEWRSRAVSRVVGNLVVEIGAAESPVREVQLDLLAQLSLEANAVTVTDDQHQIIGSRGAHPVDG
jgi:hypothetical protein